MNYVVILLLIVATSASGEVIRLNKSCNLFRRPSEESDITCRKRTGTPIERMGKRRRGFVKIDVGDCIGYVLDSCVEEFGGIPKRRRSAGISVGTPLRLGFELDGGFLSGRVDGVEGGSSGPSFGFSLNLAIPFSRKFRLFFKPIYRTIKLSRSLDADGGVLSVSNPSEFTHSIPHVGLALIASIMIRDSRATGLGREMDWWLDGGLEYLFPLSAKQTDSLGGEVPFKTNDKPLLIVLGVSGDIPAGSSFNIVAGFQLFYNLAAEESSLFGGRVSIAGQFNI